MGKRIVSPPAAARRAQALVQAVEDAVADEVATRRRALYEVGAESLLRLDVTVSDPQANRLPELEIGLSLKWSLRTDRAQDCRSQGAKLSALRRGRMPHFAALTMEPRPYMLNLLGGGSGDVDCVYHLHLPALTQAIEDVYGSQTNKNAQRTYSNFQRLVEQRRLRDYDELVKYAVSL
ncbi:type II site-specific deoxyribonuclease [Nocardioides eburneiflavus]|uniref:Type II site-specific deoxyribonuclease n=1 Tax=Nocardioides eburneiflavus TaxID=2518372 RepID=A0A4Z1CP85_9ACTN|nr:type II site-specific deoxyribonuclease [Nocardioides eburneiflavus]